MAYPYDNPYYRTPQQYQQPWQQPQAQQQTNMIQVNGIEGAKAYQLPPNSAVVLFDGNADIMYLKRTDGGGYPTIDTFTFQRMTQQPQQAVATVSVDEFESLKAEVEKLREAVNAKQSVRSRSAAKQPDPIEG